MNKFGNLIRAKREEQDMLLRHLSAELDVDTAQMSKIERGERIAKRDHVKQLIKIFKLDEDEVTAIWLADQVSALVEDENQSVRALSIVLDQIKRQQKEL